MCDNDTQKDVDEYLSRHPEMTRRDFTKLATGAGLAMMFPPMANAQSVTERDVEIRTPDGVADCYFVTPSSGAHAAVLVWPDILALRPAFREMGKRLARSGYAVLTVNPFYRDSRAPVVGRGASFGQPEIREIVLPMAGNLNADTHFTDARAFVSWLDDQPEVDTNKGIGTTGYCMGGPMVMRTVAAVPDRLAAGATFHGGGLATGIRTARICSFQILEHQCCIVLPRMTMIIIRKQKKRFAKLMLHRALTQKSKCTTTRCMVGVPLIHRSTIKPKRRELGVVY